MWLFVPVSQYADATFLETIEEAFNPDFYKQYIL